MKYRLPNKLLDEAVRAEFGRLFIEHARALMEAMTDDVRNVMREDYQQRIEMLIDAHDRTVDFIGRLGKQAFERMRQERHGETDDQERK